MDSYAAYPHRHAALVQLCASHIFFEFSFCITWFPVMRYVNWLWDCPLSFHFTALSVTMCELAHSGYNWRFPWQCFSRRWFWTAHCASHVSWRPVCSVLSVMTRGPWYSHAFPSNFFLPQHNLSLCMPRVFSTPCTWNPWVYHILSCYPDPIFSRLATFPLEKQEDICASKC